MSAKAAEEIGKPKVEATFISSFLGQLVRLLAGKHLLENLERVDGGFPPRISFLFQYDLDGPAKLIGFQRQDQETGLAMDLSLDSLSEGVTADDYFVQVAENLSQFFLALTLRRWEIVWAGKDLYGPVKSPHETQGLRYALSFRPNDLFADPFGPTRAAVPSLA